MLHRNFMDILTGIYEKRNVCRRDQYQRLFSQAGSVGPDEGKRNPSFNEDLFDGIGHHDWLRGRKGAEEDAIRAIRLCRANDFPVMIQTNVHRHNLDTLLETAKLYGQPWGGKMRIIRTSEAPRWKEKCR